MDTAVKVQAEDGCDNKNQPPGAVRTCSQVSMLPNVIRLTFVRPASDRSVMQSRSVRRPATIGRFEDNHALVTVTFSTASLLWDRSHLYLYPTMSKASGGFFNQGIRE